MDTFQELFEDQLRDVYYAEKLILRTLPKLAKKVQSEELSQAFKEHAEQTRTQVERLDQVFQELGKRARGKRCAAMEGLMAEADELMEEADESPVRDAGLLSCAQAVEHYEIARYGTLVAWAKKMGRDNIAELLEQTLNEEKETDEKLTELAESEINMQAAGEEGEEDDEEEVQERKPAPKKQAKAPAASGASRAKR